MLADGMVLWVGVAVLVGFVGFFVVVLALIIRALTQVGRWLFGWEDGASGGGWYDERVCTRRGCGQANPPEAQFCGRCGAALEAE